MPPPRSPHQLWAGQETGKKRSWRCRDGHCLWKGAGVQQARVSASRPGQRVAGWGGGSGQGLERDSVYRAVTRNEEGGEETGRGLRARGRLWT